MNGTKAYREVYPSIKSDDVAGAAAARLLGNVRVQARIAEIMRAGAERTEVTVEQVVRERAAASRRCEAIFSAKLGGAAGVFASNTKYPSAPNRCSQSSDKRS